MLTVTLRRFRTEAIGTIAALACVGLLALVTGKMMSAEYRNSGLADCLKNPGADCGDLRDQFSRRFEGLQILIVPLVLLPALLGAFVGAPLVAREVDAGTHRFLWTQGVTRVRWFVTTSAGAIALVLVAGAAYALIAGAWLDITNRVTDDRFGRMYDFQGIVPVAAALFAVALGIACGLATRRTLPAMAATLGIFVVVRVLIATQLRQRFATPLTLDAPFEGPTEVLSGTGDWILSQRTLTADGVQLGTGGGLNLSRIGDRCPGLEVGPGNPLPGRDVVERCIDQLGVHQITQYHPASRFWTFQLIESGILVALAVIAMVVAMRLLARRTT